MACIAIIKGTFLKESLHSAGIHNPASKTVSRVFAKDLLIQGVWIPLMMGHSVTPELPCLFLSLTSDQETLLSANRNLSSSLNSALSLMSHYTPQVPLSVPLTSLSSRGPQPSGGFCFSLLPVAELVWRPCHWAESPAASTVTTAPVTLHSLGMGFGQLEATLEDCLRGLGLTLGQLGNTDVICGRMDIIRLAFFKMALATAHRVHGDNKSGDTRAVRGCCKFKGVLRGGTCKWEGLAPSGRQLYPGIVCLTHCWFQKGPSIFPSKVLFYILSGLAGLPLRVAIAIFIYTQLRNGSSCSE